MKHYIIYQIRNKLNGMIYIGKHQTEDLNDGYMGSGLRIQRAIEKYGLENFEKIILFECQSVEEMNAKEAEIVNEDFIARDDVYNIKLGGEGGWDYINNNGKNLIGINKIIKNKLNNKANQHMISAIKIKQDPKYAAEFSNKISCGIKKHKQNHLDWMVGKNNPMYGHRHTNEAKRKMSIKQTGSKNSQYGKMWICNDLTKESIRIMKTDPIPEGWRKGRICKK